MFLYIDELHWQYLLEEGTHRERWLCDIPIKAGIENGERKYKTETPVVISPAAVN